MSPKISIIVPVYKAEKYLHQCVDSILEQTFTDFELLLIDDGSPDGSPQICDNYSQIDERVLVMHKSNGGQADARNYGLRFAKGNYFVFVDSDDVLPNNTLLNLVREIEESGSDIVMGKIKRFITGALSRPYTNMSNKREMTSYEALAIVLKGSLLNISLCGSIYKRSLWQGLEMPKGYIFEDWYITPHLYLKAKKITFLPIECYLYRDNPISTMGVLQKKCNSKIIDVAKHVIDVIQAENEDLYHKTLWSNVKRIWKYVGIVYKGGRRREEKDFLENVRVFIKSYIKDLLKSGEMNTIEIIGVLSFCYCPPLCSLLYKLK